MTDDGARYTLVQPPGSVWECGECGALVVRTSLHDALHARLEALEKAQARFGTGPHTLVANDGSTAFCGGPGACQACSEPDRGRWCPCGWSPVPGALGGQTLAEHAGTCPKAPPPAPSVDLRARGGDGPW